MVTNTANWTLEGALMRIRETQAAARSFGYHICLGGGVLNKGESSKDLDLYFLPLIDTPQQIEKLIESLEIGWGPSEPATSGGQPVAPYKVKLRYHLSYGPVEVFIL